MWWVLPGSLAGLAASSLMMVYWFSRLRSAIAEKGWKYTSARAPQAKSAFLGFVVESVIKRKVKKRRVYFPLDILTSHAIIYGNTRIGKSFLALIIIEEALKNGVKVIVFDPHGTLASRLESNPLLEVNFTQGRANIINELQRIYEETSEWQETNELKLLVVLDETRLLKAKNLVCCVNELGKRGVGFL